MAVQALPSRDILNQLLRYEPETGKLFWRERSVEHFTDQSYAAERVAKAWNKKNAGKEALYNLDGKGYKCGGLFGKTVRAHRVIWKMMTGNEPPQIDHINGTRDDNRMENMREVTNAENCKNMRLSLANKSGVTGVRLYDRTGRWLSEITVDGRCKFLGFYATKPEAMAARKAAERLLGYHKNHGKHR